MVFVCICMIRGKLNCSSEMFYCFFIISITKLFIFKDIIGVSSILSLFMFFSLFMVPSLSIMEGW